MTALPTGTVTFLFTDIEGSTRLLEARPEAYRAALARHDAILTRAIEAHGGLVFERAGDSFAAAFTSPLGAVQAALAGQRALHREPWSEGGTLRVRVGVHTGEVEVQGGQYFGLTLHRCARLMASAHGGQVLLSSATAGLVRESLPPEVHLVDLGEHHLKDLAQPERIFQLAGPGLTPSFPRLLTPTAFPNNLPRQATTFVGRERQIEAVRATVLQPDVRLLTLTGPGGTGKTRLALQVAADLLDAFPDGVFFVALASVTDPALVPSAIAQALDVREAAGRSILESLREFLRPRRLLLVLDNFEQVVEAAPVVAELLATPAGLKIVVTSRAALRLYGEQECPVPPLALPDRRAAPSADHLAHFEAVRLFVSRAKAARPEFVLDDRTAPDVADICHRLDGLPLAIELAAARIRALPPGALLQRMERRLPLLTGGARDLPARQRTLRDAIAWSYDLLDPGEQTLFRRLAVFRGCTLETAETVCVGEPPRPGSTSVALPLLDLDILDGVASLVEKSLLRQEEASDGQPWYVMLETVREYALERLEESGEAGAAYRRHALAALRLAESLEPELDGLEQARSLARLEQEHDNLRGALRWCTERGYAEPALRLAVALWSFWAAHGHVSEGSERLTALLARFPPRASSPRAELGARALFAAATLATIQGDLGRSRALYEEGLALRRAIGDRGGVRASLEGIGTVASLQGEHAVARRCLEEALAIARDEDDHIAESTILSNLGNVAYEAGDLDVARTYYVAVNALLDGHEDGYRAIGTDLALALVAHDLGEYDGAEVAASRGLAHYRRSNNRRLEALALATLGGIALARGRLASAHDHLSASIATQQDVGDVAGVGQVLERFAELAVAQGRPEGAIRLVAAATALRERAGAPRSRRGQLKLDPILEVARQALSAEAADLAWQAGQALGVDEAIAAALAITELGPSSGAPAATPERVEQPGAGPSILTRREQEVAALIARGLTNRQIAEHLVITEGTAANHVVHILNKLGYSSRTQVAVWAAEHDLLADRPER